MLAAQDRVYAFGISEIYLENIPGQAASELLTEKTPLGYVLAKHDLETDRDGYEYFSIPSRGLEFLGPSDE